MHYQKNLYSKWILYTLCLAAFTHCGKGQRQQGSSNMAAPMVVVTQQKQSTFVGSLKGDVQLQKRLIGTDLRDIARFKAKEIPLAPILLNGLIENSKFFLPIEVKLSTEGPDYEKSSRWDAVYGIEFTKIPEFNENQKEWRAELVLHIHSSHTGYFFRIIEVFVSDQTKKILKINTLETIDAQLLTWSLRVGLAERKVVLESADRRFKKLYPLGVGGFDFGITKSSNGKPQLLTPTINDVQLNEKAIILSRVVPEYYEGRPFLRILKGEDELKDITPYAFHGKIDPIFSRGFVSHGCMRMRDKDLYELLAILQTVHKLPVEISLVLSNVIEEHPYPLENKRFKSVTNFGSKENPRAGRDEEGLTIMHWEYKRPPLEVLIPESSSIQRP